MTWIWSYLSVSTVSLYRYLIMRRLKSVEQEQTADKEGWLKLHQCVKISFLFDSKGTVSSSPCSASDKPLRSHPFPDPWAPHKVKETGCLLKTSWPKKSSCFSFKSLSILFILWLYRDITVHGSEWKAALPAAAVATHISHVACWWQDKVPH